MDRRSFLGSAGVLALGYSFRRLSAFVQTPKFSADPFSAGIASGDPAPDGIVLWTRLMTDTAQDQAWQREAVQVDWQIASDERFKSVVRSGREMALPEYGHSVHADVSGLRPNRWYWYRFQAGSAESVIGRTKTAPASPVDRIRFAFASCQQFHAGHYTAYQHMAKADLDLVVFLGDYIYESGGGTGSRVVPRAEPMDLAGYRNRYALYRSDEHLREAHRLFPWIITWDDHEVDDNYAGEIPRDRQPAAEFLKRRAAAYQAHYEWLPLPKACIPIDGHSRLYRRLSYGPLASFLVLDGRQFRDNQPCGDNTKAPCAAFYEDRSMLGEKQERWLDDEFKASRATWNIVANQVRLTPVDSKAGPEEAYSMDQWAGYETARRRLITSMRDNKLSNPIVVTGDVHSNWVGDLKIDYHDSKSPVVGTEFVGTSISTGGDGSAETPAPVQAYLAEAPQIHFFNGQRGYVTCEVTAKSMVSNYHVVEKISVKDAPVSTLARFVVENGKPGVQFS